MKLAVVDLTCAPSAKLAARLRRDYDFLMLALPLPGFATDQNGVPRIASVSNVEAVKRRLLLTLAALFEDGARDKGPRANGAVCSFAAAADYSLFMESRFPFVLLNDIGEFVDLPKLRRIDLFSDSPRAGACRLPLLCLAKTLAISLRVYEFGRRGQGAKEWLVRHLPDPTQPWWLALRQRMRRFSGTQKPAPTLADSRACQSSLRTAMLVYHPKSARHLLPVRDELIQLGHSVTFFSPRPEVSRYLGDANCPHRDLPNSLPSRRLSMEVSDYLRGLPLKLSSAGGPGDILINALKRVMERLAYSELIRYVSCAAPLALAFEKGSFRLALGSDSGSTVGRTFFLTAERLGLATAFLQHGAFTVAPDVAPYFTAARIFTWGETSRQQLIDAGVENPDRIIAIGSPFEEDRLLDLASVPSLPRPLVLVAFGVPGNLVPERPFLAACREVVVAAERRPECDFIVKPHPGDHTHVWQRAIDERGAANITVRRDRDTYDLLKQCRLLITMFSTTGAEAAYLGKPVISVNLEQFPATNDFLRAGAAYTAQQPGELSAALSEILLAPAGKDRLTNLRKEFAARLLHREDRPAKRRIAEALEELGLARARSRSAC